MPSRPPFGILMCILLRLTVNIRGMCDRWWGAPVRRGNRRAACVFVGRAVDLTYEDLTSHICVRVCATRTSPPPRWCRHVCEVCEHCAEQCCSVGTSGNWVCVYAVWCACACACACFIVNSSDVHFMNEMPLRACTVCDYSVRVCESVCLRNVREIVAWEEE